MNFGCQCGPGLTFSKKEIELSVRNIDDDERELFKEITYCFFVLKEIFSQKDLTKKEKLLRQQGFISFYCFMCTNLMDDRIANSEMQNEASTKNEKTAPIV